MSDVEPVGEFGSREWCEACAEWSIKQLLEADLPADMAWGFSEVYTHLPERLMPEGREVAGYYILVKEGKISAGARRTSRPCTARQRNTWANLTSW